MTAATDDSAQAVETHFAPPGRVGPAALRRQMEALLRLPMLESLLRMAGGLLAVLNEQRQVLAVNDALLEYLGLHDAADVLGIRPGEAVRCVHAHEMPAGCGTSRFCSTCGLAIALVATLADRRAVERHCAVTVDRNGSASDLYLAVRACPVEAIGEQFILVFLQDITDEARRSSLTRAFFHDVSNLAGGLVGASEVLQESSGSAFEEARHQVQDLSRRLAREIEIQKALYFAEQGEYQPLFEELDVSAALHEVRATLVRHEMARGRAVLVTACRLGERVRTDRSLLLRILTNMLTNALEATQAGGTVRLWAEPDRTGVTFAAWNACAIDPPVARRVFERHFTSKTGMGRGLGTYAMKLFGEQYLGGVVSFETSEEGGTVFRLWLPRNGPGERSASS